MNSHDSLVLVTQIVEAKNQIIDAVKESKSYTLKDLAPMIGAIGVGLVSAGIAIWSLKRNTNYDREKRAEDRKKDILHTIRKIYGELVALNIQLEVRGVELNIAELSYKYEMAKPPEIFNKAYFDESLNDFVKLKREVSTIKHQYLSLLSEYKFLTDSTAIVEVIHKLSNLKLRINRDYDFKDVPVVDMRDTFKKVIQESAKKTEDMVIEIGQQIEHIILSEKNSH